MNSLSIYFVLMFGWVTTACGVAPQGQSISDTSAPASGMAQSRLGGFHNPMGWENQGEVHVHEDVPKQILPAVLEAIDVWNEAIGFNLVRFAGLSSTDRGTTLYASLGDESTILYYETSWEATTGKSAMTLATTIWENQSGGNGHIERGDIILNGEYWAYADAKEAGDEGGEPWLVDASTVIIHEIGHLLGLGHVDDEDDESSVMSPYTKVGPGAWHRHLSSGDTHRIRTIYNP